MVINNETLASDDDDDDIISNNNDSSTNEFQWCITWIRAYPTLLPFMLYVEENDTVWQNLAFEHIFSECKSTKAVISSHIANLQLGEEVEDNDDDEKETRTEKEEKTPKESYPRHNNNDNVNNNKMNVHPHSVLDNNLGYGEITSEAVFSILKWIRHDMDTNNNVNDSSLSPAPAPAPIPSSSFSSCSVVVDLGSGNGKVLFAAALACPLAHAIGLEILPELHEEALQNLAIWERKQQQRQQQQQLQWQTMIGHHHHHQQQQRQHLPAYCLFDFRCTDIRKQSSSFLNDVKAKIVFVHATVFDQQLMEYIQQLSDACSVGTYFVMVTKPLQQQCASVLSSSSSSSPSSSSPLSFAETITTTTPAAASTTTAAATAISAIVTLKELQLPMNWGQATVYIQQKKKMVL